MLATSTTPRLSIYYKPLVRDADDGGVHGDIRGRKCHTGRTAGDDHHLLADAGTNAVSGDDALMALAVSRVDTLDDHELHAVQLFVLLGRPHVAYNNTYEHPNPL